MFIFFSIRKCVLTVPLQNISCNSNVLVKTYANGTNEKMKLFVRYIDVIYDTS